MINYAVVRGGAVGALASPEFGDSEKRTDREIDTSITISTPRFEDLTTVLVKNRKLD